jgi:hypothetical protein
MEIGDFLSRCKTDLTIITIKRFIFPFQRIARARAIAKHERFEFLESFKSQSCKNEEVKKAQQVSTSNFIAKSILYMQPI